MGACTGWVVLARVGHPLRQPAQRSGDRSSVRRRPGRSGRRVHRPPSSAGTQGLAVCSPSQPSANRTALQGEAAALEAKAQAGRAQQEAKEAKLKRVLVAGLAHACTAARAGHQGRWVQVHGRVCRHHLIWCPAGLELAGVWMFLWSLNLQHCTTSSLSCQCWQVKGSNASVFERLQARQVAGQASRLGQASQTLAAMHQVPDWVLDVPFTGTEQQGPAVRPCHHCRSVR